MKFETLLRIPFWLLRLSLWIALFAALAFAGSTIAGIVYGFALPTTAIFQWSGLARQVGLHDHYIAHFFLVMTSLGAVSSWAFAISGKAYPDRDIQALTSFVRTWGLFVILCLFVFSISSMWSGLVRSGDFNAASIGGLIAFSDAGGYFADSHDVVRDGIFSTFSLRRPLAAAFRLVVMAAGDFSYAKMLFVQALMLSIAVWLAARSIVSWLGPLAALAFMALSFMFSRSFLPTTLTEPLGLFWAFLSIPCFVQALRNRSIAFALLGFTLNLVALMTRMGAMFLIPALALWLVICFGDTWRKKFAIGVAVVGIVGLVWSVNSVLTRVYGAGADVTGGNFSYTICGLSIGENWSGCPIRYADEFKAVSNDEVAYTKFLYKRALENILHDPITIAKRLLSGGSMFVRSTPSTFLNGYLASEPTRWLPARLFLIVATAGLLMLLMLRLMPLNLVFWFFAISGIVSSSMFVFFDDGTRVMACSYPLIALFLVTGLTVYRRMEKVPEVPERIQIWWYGGFVAAMFVVFLTLPGILHRFAPTPLEASSDPTEVKVFGGRRMTGFLIVEDGQPLPRDVPSLHFSDFSNIMKQSNIQQYQPLISVKSPTLPFGFIAAPRRESRTASSYQYIVPPEVVTRGDVEAWKFKTAEWTRIEGNGVYWYLVTNAEPLTVQP